MPLPTARKKYVHLSPHQKVQVDNYARSHELSEGEALRELIALGLSSSPTEETVRIAAQRAFDRTRQWSITKAAQFFRDAAAELDRQGGTRIMEAP